MQVQNFPEPRRFLSPDTEVSYGDAIAIVVSKQRFTVGFMAGVYQFQNVRGWRLIWVTILGSLYMVHWIPVMIFVTLRMCLKGERSEWVKTEHYG